jgi:two-component system, NarL family, invasion response regulator UvrY
MRILLADNLLMIRSGIGCLLQQSFDQVEIAEIATDVEAYEALSRSRYDLVVICASMLNRRGVRLIAGIAEKYPKLPVLALDKTPDVDRGVEALQAGARGYLPQNKPEQDLIKAVQRCIEGKHYIPEDLVAEFAVVTQRHERAEPHERFSRRENEVFLGLAKGIPVTRMAEALGISVKSVSTYRARVLEKLHVESNADLVRYAMQKGIV